jgi:predicted O-linked N-acetylglucosamine transferase (SPINDLY family)
VTTQGSFTPEPGSAEAFLVQAATHHQAGRLAEAERLYRAVLERLPDSADAHHNLGVLFMQSRRPVDEALRHFRLAWECDPAHPQYGLSLARALAHAGRAEEARRLLSADADTHATLGNSLAAQGRLDAAIANYRRALELQPGHAAAYVALGQILASRRRLDEAEALCRQMIAALPTSFEAHRDLGVILAMQGRVSDAAASCRHAVQLRPDDPGVRSALLFNLGYVADATPQALLAEAQAYGRVATRRAAGAFDSWACAPAPERLRVGLVSADLCEHPVGYFLESILAGAQGGRIEWRAYPTQPSDDALSRRLRDCVSGWHCIDGLPDGDAARRIHDDGNHVLLDLSGHTARNRLPVFAWRPAPVQASWLGYFATTGVEQMDYLLADRTGVPPTLQDQFTETIWYLPDTRLCFTPPRTDLPVAPLPALRRGFITFGCFQALAKLNDDVVSLWSRILSACGGSRLRIQAASLTDSRASAALLERLRARGIDPARVELHGAMARGDYLAAHADVDLLLDTFPYPGGTTTCEALWMGVPTVTLAGGTMLARQGASLLCAAGLGEWVAQTRDDYVAIACAMAGDVARLAGLRARLREQVGLSPLVDAGRFARHLEDALWGMWEARRGAGATRRP